MLDARRELSGSARALQLALDIVAHDPNLLVEGPVVLPQLTLEEIRELAYLAVDLQSCSSAAEITLRLARWMRKRVPATCPLHGTAICLDRP